MSPSVYTIRIPYCYTDSAGIVGKAVLPFLVLFRLKSVANMIATRAECLLYKKQRTDVEKSGFY